VGAFGRRGSFAVRQGPNRGGSKCQKLQDEIFKSVHFSAWKGGGCFACDDRRPQEVSSGAMERRSPQISIESFHRRPVKTKSNDSPGVDSHSRVSGNPRLEADLGGKTYSISGPNGSGKSGVVDAIEFALTRESRG